MPIKPCDPSLVCLKFACLNSLIGRIEGLTQRSWNKRAANKMTKEQRKTSYCMYLARRKNYSTMIISADTVTLWNKQAIWNSGYLILVCAYFQSILFSCTNKMNYLFDGCCQIRHLLNIMQHKRVWNAGGQWAFLILFRARVFISVNKGKI